MATLNVSNASQLQTALNAATGGDVILLASGSYGTLAVNGRGYGSYVTIRSAEQYGAKFSNVSVFNSSYLRIDGVHVDNGTNGADGGKLVNIDQGSHHIELLNSEVNGKVDSNYSGWWGIHSGTGSDIRFENNYIHDVLNGGTFFNTRNVWIIGNTFDRIGNDTMKLAFNDGVVIEDNFGAGNIFPPPGAHLDFIQFQGSANNITICGNVLLPATRADIQAIFMADGTYNNVLIEQNILYTGMVHGITLYSGSNVRVRNNTVLNLPGLVHDTTIINVPSGSVVDRNITGTRSGGGMSGTNVTAQHGNPSGAYYYGGLFANATRGLGITLADLRPVAGSMVDFGSGYGAEQRLAELLDADVGDPPPPPPPPPPDPDPDPDPVETRIVFREDAPQIPSEYPHDPALAVEHGTIAFTFSTRDTGALQGVISKDATNFGNGGHFSAYVQSGMLKVRFQNAYASETLTHPIEPDTAYSVVCEFGEESVVLWVNGDVAADKLFDYSMTGNAEYLQIGALGWASAVGAAGHSNTLSGTVKDVVIVNELMDPDELDLFLNPPDPCADIAAERDQLAADLADMTAERDNMLMLLEQIALAREQLRASLIEEEKRSEDLAAERDALQAKIDAAKAALA